MLISKWLTRPTFLINSICRPRFSALEKVFRTILSRIALHIFTHTSVCLHSPFVQVGKSRYHCGIGPRFLPLGQIHCDESASSSAESTHMDFESSKSCMSCKCCLGSSIFSRILDACKPRKVLMISKTDTIWYATWQQKQTQNMLMWKELYMLAAKRSREVCKMVSWLHHPTIQEQVEWTLVTANCVQIYPSIYSAVSFEEFRSRILSQTTRRHLQQMRSAAPWPSLRPRWKCTGR